MPGRTSLSPPYLACSVASLAVNAQLVAVYPKESLPLEVFYLQHRHTALHHVVVDHLSLAIRLRADLVPMQANRIVTLQLVLKMILERSFDLVNLI